MYQFTILTLFLKKITIQYAAELDTKLKQGHIFEVLILSSKYYKSKETNFRPINNWKLLPFTIQFKAILSL